MNYYLAPMEGITNHIYRRTYHKYFSPMDKYFSPFLTPHTKRDFNTRERKDILPENNVGMYLVPQILSNQAEGFIQTARKLKDLGYGEINLNLGCPSKTVVSRGRGAGFLRHTEQLEKFLDQIFSELNLRISIKTRIGMNDPDEFEALLELFNRFPLEELIVHPRTGVEMYRGYPNLEIFELAMEKSKAPVCYNGDLYFGGREKRMEELSQRFPKLSCVMMGRGVLTNPLLLEDIRRINAPQKAKNVDKAENFQAVRGKKERIRAFHDELVTSYMEEMSAERNVLFKLKELWSYMANAFVDSEKPAKKIRKSNTLEQYEAAVNTLFNTCILKNSSTIDS